MFVRPGFVYLGSSSSNTDLILRAKITSAGGNDDGVLSLGVIRYTWRNCCRAFPMGVPLAFFRALFSVSTKRSVCPLNLGWYGAIVIWLIRKVSQKSLKSPDVNCIPLSDTRQSTTPNLVNSSLRKIDCNFCCGVSTFKNFGPIRKGINYYKIVDSV